MAGANREQVGLPSGQTPTRARSPAAVPQSSSPLRTVPPVPVAVARPLHVLRPETDPLLTLPRLRPVPNPSPLLRLTSSADMGPTFADNEMDVRPVQTFAVEVPVALPVGPRRLPLAVASLRLVEPLAVEGLLPRPIDVETIPLLKAERPWPTVALTFGIAKVAQRLVKVYTVRPLAARQFCPVAAQPVSPRAPSDIRLSPLRLRARRLPVALPTLNVDRLVSLLSISRRQGPF